MQATMQALSYAFGIYADPHINTTGLPAFTLRCAIVRTAKSTHVPNISVIATAHATKVPQLSR